jgi:hypothetical protein
MRRGAYLPCVGVVLVALLVAAVTRTDAAARPSATFALGDRQVETGADSDVAGTAEAFSTVASASGTVRSIHVYVDAGSGASTLVAGIYADGGGHPGRLLRQGKLRSPSAGAWNTVSVAGTPVVGGRTYWITLLSPAGSGTLRFRDLCCNGGHGANETSASANLASLPSTWSTGTEYHDAPVSAYAATAFPVHHVTARRPAAPRRLAKTGATRTTIAVRWQRSGGRIAGYGVYVGSRRVASTSRTRYVFAHLHCGRRYRLAVDAFERTGRRSARTGLRASTVRCAGAEGVPPPPSPAPPPVPPSVFLSPSGSDGNPCSRSAPCRSFQRGFSVAEPGQGVQLAGGNYGNQSIRGTKPAPGVTFEPAPDATVTVRELNTGDFGPVFAGGVTFRDLVVQTRVNAIATQRLALVNIDARNFYFNGVQDVLVKGGDWGPCTSSVEPCDNSKIDRYASDTGYQNQNITVDGAYFHDYRIGNPSDHFECMIIFSGSNITVKNSRFRNCEFYDIFMQYIDGSRNYNNITIENNFFDIPWNGRGGQVRPSGISFSQRGNTFRNVTVRYNSFRDGTGIEWSSDNSGGFDNARAVANLIGKPGCMRGVSYSYNLFTGAHCSSTDRSVGGFGYVDESSLDLHLAAGSPAIDAGNPNDFPATDIDGKARPRGDAPDAGASERG